MSAALFFTRPRVVFLCASLCCLLWGSAYPAIKTGYLLLAIARDDVASQLVFAGYRFMGAGGLLLGFAALSGKSLGGFTPRQLGQLLVLGVGQTTLQYVFFYIGLAHTTGVKASILNAVGAFFSVVLAHWLHANDRLSVRKIIGCLIGFAGVVTVNLGGTLGLEFSWLGEGFIILAALVLSSASIYGRRVSQGMDSVVMTGYQLALGGAVLWALGCGFGGTVRALTLESGALLAYLAALSAIAFALWGVLLKYNKVSKVTIYNFLIPIFGAGLSALFLGESLWAWKNLAALALVSLGIWWVTQPGKERLPG
ncbi:MAG: EamA family transporter [Burkholderiales bacterium PBB3]|nr:MAG: EamA family transporter [Burkholderiales bacterium PBB3]